MSTQSRVISPKGNKYLNHGECTSNSDAWRARPLVFLPSRALLCSKSETGVPIKSTFNRFVGRCPTAAHRGPSRWSTLIQVDILPALHKQDDTAITPNSILPHVVHIHRLHYCILSTFWMQHFPPRVLYPSSNLWLQFKCLLKTTDFRLGVPN